MKKRIETFTAVDAKGNKYQIECYQDSINTSNLNEFSSTPGLKEYRHASGYVNDLGNGRFKIVATDIEVQKIS